MVSSPPLTLGLVLLVVLGGGHAPGVAARSLLQMVAPPSVTGQAASTVQAPLQEALSSGNTAAGTDAIKSTTTTAAAAAAANAAPQQVQHANLMALPPKAALTAPVTSNFLNSLKSAGAQNPNAAALTVAQLGTANANTIALVSTAIGQAILTHNYGSITNVLALAVGQYGCSKIQPALQKAQLAVALAQQSSQFQTALHEIPNPAGEILINCLNASNGPAQQAVTAAAQAAAPLLGGAVHALASLFGR